MLEFYRDTTIPVILTAQAVQTAIAPKEVIKQTQLETDKIL